MPTSYCQFVKSVVQNPEVCCVRENVLTKKNEAPYAFDGLQPEVLLDGLPRAMVCSEKEAIDSSV